MVKIILVKFNLTEKISKTIFILYGPINPKY